MQSQTPTAKNPIPRIALLEEHLIDQIKAGEVMESPANMAKELIENAIDAKSTKITLRIKSNPMEYFSIKDNGHGILPEDFPLVFARHATSKIHHYNDIYQLTSYGFRGEALASLGSIAHISMTSTTATTPTHQLEHHHGQTRKIQRCTTNQESTGTEIIVTELFESTPARLKFVQQKLTELQKFRKMIMSFILAYPNISWDWHDDHDFKRYTPESLHERVKKILSENVEKKELTYKNITLTLWLDTKPAKKKNHLWQFIYVNKRPIQFGLMHSILVKNLGFSPSYAIFIETKQENLDVNVHPAKTEVKFFDKAAVLSILTTLLKSFEQKHVLPDQLSTGVSNPETFKNQTNNTSVLHPQYGLQCFPSTEENICVLSDNGLISAFIYFDRLLHHVFTNNSLNLSEDNAVALLITKSFSYSKKHLTKAFLDYWSQLGLRLAYDEREQKWILHTIPNLWPLLNYGFIVESIIQKNLMNLATLAKHIDCSKCVPPENIALILEHTEREKLVKERILIPLKGLL